MTQLRISFYLVLILTLTACGQGTSTVIDSPTPLAANTETLALAPDWPDVLPVDGIEPWEQLDQHGFIQPLDSSRATAGLMANSEFCPGVEARETAGLCSKLGEALTLCSGSLGNDELSWAMYRLNMGGMQPGVLALDINLQPLGADALSSYHLGVSDYTTGSWQWFGPFNDGREILPLPAGDWLSSLGNLFVTVAAFNGASLDIVGIGAHPLGSDDNPPAAPSALVVHPVSNGLAVEWTGVAASDLAGYQLYWAIKDFASPTETGVNKLPYLVSHESHVLTGLNTVIPSFVRVAAIDVSGNESDLSPVDSATPLAGVAQSVCLQVAVPSGELAYSAQLTATGAAVYDWDLDGDGVYEVGGDPTGIQSADTTATGIIRPRVRGTTGEAQMYGAVSLIVISNMRPVASAYATPASGIAPLQVNFGSSAIDFDGTISNYLWDFDSDQIWDYATPTEADRNPPPQWFHTPGTYNVKFRVNDDQGAWDVDTVTVTVGKNLPPVAMLTADPPDATPPFVVQLDASASFDLDGYIAEYQWDLDNDGTYETTTGTPAQSVTVTDPGEHIFGLRIVDDHGLTQSTAVEVVSHGWVHVVVDGNGSNGLGCQMKLVDGKPAICYRSTYGTAQIRYARALTQTGATSWSNTLVAFSTSTHSALNVVYGNPAISYRTTDGTLSYARAQNSTGMGTTWDIVSVDSSINVGEYNSLAMVAGRPAISYYDANLDDLKYARAQTSVGTGGGWDIVTVDSTNNVGEHTSLAVVDGFPAIAYYYGSVGQQKYARADNTTGIGASWATLFISTTGGGYCELALVSGNPAIVYQDWGTDLVYTRADNPTGLAANWINTTLYSDTWGGVYNSVAVIDGKPAVCSIDADDDLLYYYHSNSLNGEFVETWTEKYTVTSIGTSTGSSFRTSLIEVPGRYPAIAWFEHDNNNLMYSVLF